MKAKSSAPGKNTHRPYKRFQAMTTDGGKLNFSVHLGSKKNVQKKISATQIHSRGSLMNNSFKAAKTTGDQMRPANTTNATTQELNKELQITDIDENKHESENSSRK